MTINTNAWNRIRYTLWAPIYDRIAAFPTYRRHSVDMLGLVPGEEVLIVGAGTGADLPHLLFSDITRKLGPILAHTNLVVEREESGRIVGVPYRTVVLTKKG